MSLFDVSDLYHLISRGTEDVLSRKEARALRRTALDLVSNEKGLKKIAFDTRRIDQETEYNPRRGLQNYHRSENFVSDAIMSKIQAFAKLAVLLDKLKTEFGRQPEWQDSYTRILTSSVHKGLRTHELDGDYSDAQPSMASLDYLEELMYVRYRLTPENLLSMSEVDLRKAILRKDELLVNGEVIQNKDQIITTSDVSKYSYDQMMDKMINTIAQVMSNQKSPDDNLTNKLFDVKATKDAPEIERTVTITIKDKIVDNIQKISEQVIENTKVAQEEIKETTEEIVVE